MAKFAYRMQSILDIKYKLEEQEKTAYGIANQRLQEENRKLQQLMLRRMEYEKRAGWARSMYVRSMKTGRRSTR